jgi:predicted HD phosphohydrolase
MIIPEPFQVTALLVEIFERPEIPYLADAVRLRRWDDTAKVVGLEVPTLDAYQGMVEKITKS